MSYESGAPKRDAQQVREEAAAWIQRRAFWKWDVEDEVELERWLSVSPSHRVAYFRVKAVWERTERLTALRAPQNPRVAQTAPNRSRFIFSSVVAAVAVFTTIGAFAMLELPRFGQQEFMTAIGNHRIISLSDGSKIELNTNSILRLSKSQREAWLDQGEAYFQIVHDAQHPFSVLVAGKRVEDLGTRFAIRAETGKFTVGLFEGKASIKASGASHAIELAILNPGNVATVTDRGLTVTTKTEQALRNAMAWRRNMLIFNNTQLIDIAAQLNRYNQRKVVIAGPSLGRMRIDASIPTNGVEAFVRVAKNYLRLHVEAHEREIVISR